MSQPKRRAGVDAAGPCIQRPDINTVLKHTVGPDGLSVLLHKTATEPRCSNTVATQCAEKTAALQT